MSKTVDLLKEREIKLLVKYTIPCILGMLGLSFCILIDTIFIGRRFGSMGLAALNLSLPVYNIFNALSLTLGVGGATVLSISIGEGKLHKANEIFTTAIIGTFVVTLIISIINILFIDKICYALGASPNTFPLVKSYVRVILFFNWSFLFITLLSVFVRCDKAPKLAMIAMIVGNITNIILDYIFIFPLDLGLGGAALATSMGQMAGILVLLSHFIKNNSTIHLKIGSFNFKTLERILKNGFTSFITELSAGYAMFIFNLSVFSILGDLGVSSYGIINNIFLIFIAIFNGLAQGIQPIVSVNFGAKKHSRLKKLLQQSLTIALSMGGIFLLLCLLFPRQLIGLFTADTGTLLETTINGSKIYFLSLLLCGVNLVNISYLQAVENSRSSMLLSIVKGLLFITLYIFILPKIWGVNGIWATVPITELSTLILGIYLIKQDRKKRIAEVGLLNKQVG